MEKMLEKLMKKYILNPYNKNSYIIRCYWKNKE